MDILSSLEKIFSSETLGSIFLGILIYLAFLWIAIIVWVTKDITNRTNNLTFQIISISLVIFLTPVFGLVLYLIIRPSRSLVERYYEDIEQDLLDTWFTEFEKEKKDEAREEIKSEEKEKKKKPLK